MSQEAVEAPTTLTYEIKVYRNPWSEIISGKQLLIFLAEGADEMVTWMQKRLANGKIEPGKDSFGTALLDPTRPFAAMAPAELIYATISIGPNGDNCIPNAAAKAYPHNRFGVPNGVLIERRMYCLGSGDFLWPNSVEFEGAIGAGSGLTAKQDAKLVRRFLRLTMPKLHEYLTDWVQDQRDNHLDTGWGWFNQANQPPKRYREILGFKPITSLESHEVE